MDTAPTAYLSGWDRITMQFNLNFWRGTQTKRRAVAFSGALGLGIAALAMVTSPAYAIHTNNKFELDGNATSLTMASPRDDWDRVCHQVRGLDCTTSSDTNGATAVSWTADGANIDGSSFNASIFRGGGSKDPQDINNWKWVDNAGGLPDKDNLMHSFAARYNTDEGDVLFFGYDRYDNSGDAQ